MIKIGEATKDARRLRIDRTKVTQSGQVEKEKAENYTYLQLSN